MIDLETQEFWDAGQMHHSKRPLKLKFRLGNLKKLYDPETPTRSNWNADDCSVMSFQTPDFWGKWHTVLVKIMACFVFVHSCCCHTANRQFFWPINRLQWVSLWANSQLLIVKTQVIAYFIELSQTRLLDGNAAMKRALYLGVITIILLLFNLLSLLIKELTTPMQSTHT